MMNKNTNLPYQHQFIPRQLPNRATDANSKTAKTKAVVFPLRYFYEHLQAIRYSLKHLKQHPISSVLTTFAISISLALPLLLYVLLTNVQDLTQHWQNGTQITLFLKQQTESATTNLLLQKLRTDPDIADVRFISAEQGLTEFRAETALNDVLANLPQNPLPAVIEVRPKAHLQNPNAISDLYSRLKQEPEVNNAALDKDWINRLQHILLFFKQLTYILEGLFSTGVCLVIMVMIRLAIQQHRHDLEVLKLVTASPRYMRRPFLYTGIFYSFVGGIIAWIITEFALASLNQSVKALAHAYQSQFLLSGLSLTQSAVFIMLCILMGFVSARLAASWTIEKIKIL